MLQGKKKNAHRHVEPTLRDVSEKLDFVVEFVQEHLVTKEDLRGELKKEIAGVEYRLKDYMDHKFADHTSDMFKRLDKRYEEDRQFKSKVVELFKKHRIGTEKDIAFLEGYLAARP